MPPTSRRRTGFAVSGVALLALFIAGIAVWSLHRAPPPPPIEQRQALVDVVDGPGGQDRVQLDTTLFAPAQTPAPAILIAPGFGEDKNTAAGQALDLARRGFTVVTYSARGFGHSTGQIGLNAPEYEVADARQLLDWMARQPEVLRDGENDPRVGVTGDSYGGALALLLAGSDPRVDAIAPVMTYNNLAQALLPNNAASAPVPERTPAAGIFGDQGVYKREWAGLLFSSGGTRSPAPPAQDTSAGQPSTPPNPITCGNFTPEVCAAYTEVAQAGTADPATLALLTSDSPSSVTKNIKIPTMLVQGERDTLFGLDQADANARQIAAAGGKVQMIWYDGGHDGAPPGPQLNARVADWFAARLGLPGYMPTSDTSSAFSYEVPGTPRRDGTTPERTVTAANYPGIDTPPTPKTTLRLSGPPATVINPAGGVPAAVSSIPGTGGAAGQFLAQDVPGEVAVFRSPAVSSQVVISGVPRTRISVAAVPGQPGTGDAVLFAKLYDVAPDGGQRTLLGNAVSALRVPNLPVDGTPVQVDVALPGLVHALAAGHHLELAISTTDQAYMTSTAPAVYRISLAGPSTLSVPSVPGIATGTGAPVAPLTGIALLVLLAALIAVAGRLRRREEDRADPALSDTPLACKAVSKSYTRKRTAVHDVSMRVERGQIVGLLGPNGAGKTTTLRMVLGLLRPSSGQIRIFGHVVRPGAAVLSRLGALVEGPGFQPHLSGVDNLRYYWAATGRPTRHARFDEALRFAGLGSAARRKVRTYSHGMKQRLAIAQAMLGLPDLLVLDEPTNGLDPPQIHQIREVLRRYASTGRAVLLSSHLLAEVEQTCTHVVVMHQGQVVTAGSVEDIVSAGSQATFRVDEPEQAAAALRSLEGLGDVRTDGDLVHADLAGHTTAVAVNALVASGVSISQVAPRRRLEDAFLQLVDGDSALLPDQDAAQQNGHVSGAHNGTTVADTAKEKG